MTITIDTETSGLSSIAHGIISLSYILESDSKTLAKGKITMNPKLIGRKVDDTALEINGYTHEQIDGFQHPKEAMAEYIQVCNNYREGEKLKVIGYNVQFDVGFIQKTFESLNLGQYGFIFDYKTIDPFEIIKFLQHMGHIDTGKSQSLIAACKYFGVPLENAHDSDDDAMATKKLYDILCERVCYVDK